MDESLVPRAVLRATALTKAYAGVHALTDASLELHAGEVHALVGENGAGKSTLIRILTGAVQPDGGEVSVAGRVVTDSSPRLAKQLGITAIYQQPALFPELSVAENIALGVEPTRLWRRIRWRERRARASELLARVGAHIDPEVEAGTLTMPQQQLVEIARAIGADAKVLILDEPTASLAEADVRNLFAVIRELRTRGVGIIYISHRLEELGIIADRVTVLRDGSTIATHAMGDITRDRLIQLMVGRELTSVYAKRSATVGANALDLRGLGCTASGVRDVHLTVSAGEIVGLAGLVGSGRTELARILFGLTPADAGEIRLRGTAVTIANPSRAIACGIGYVPEDRRRHGVVLEMAVSANITLASLHALRRRGALNVARERAIAADYTRRLGIKTPALFTPVSALSGGNQQKVALSRWLATEPSVLVLDEPTQGIDIGAKAEIHALMSDLAARGIAILLISSELPEILAMSDRIAVMRGGTIAGFLGRTEATQQSVLALALGHAVGQGSPA
ncbi:MAG: sugar ABC transporter ATP-binding protein [Gemmatimonadaceae bacterium]